LPFFSPLSGKIEKRLSASLSRKDVSGRGDVGVGAKVT
jgi:hypothetical protein